MKRLLSIVLSCALILTGCAATDYSDVSVEVLAGSEAEVSGNDAQEVEDVAEIVEIEEETVSFYSLNDPELLQYIEDSIYAELEYTFGSEDYIIEDISTTYVSKEYLEELEYNSRENIFFGYTLSELDAHFDGTRYVFSCGEDGTTIVQKFEKYDDTYDQVIKNVAIGAGVILVCVTVSVITGGLGVGTVSMIFAASAKTGTAVALSSGLMSGVASGVITQFQTGDFEESLKAAALSGSEGFQWGAIGGAVTGGAEKALSLYKASKVIPTPRESELRVLEKYGGSEQMSFLNGEEVTWGTPTATRPDIVRYKDGVFEAIEVKNYNLNSVSCRNGLYSELERQVSSRVANLPVGSTQKIVLDVKGRRFSKDLIEAVVNNIKVKCANIYPDIPVDILY